VCRIYPAEINPFIELQPAHKACPPEAWTTDRPLLQRSGRLMDAGIRQLIQESRGTDVREVQAKQRMCAMLRLDSAAMAGEGFVVYSRHRGEMLAALTRPGGDAEPTAPPSAWRFISNQAATVAALVSLGAVGTLVGTADVLPFEYLGFKPAIGSSE
jgi:hypothetical protein